MQGSDAPRLRAMADTSDSANKRHPARPKRSIGTLRSTFKKTPNRAAKEPRHPLRGCRGATLPAFARWPTPLTLQTSGTPLVPNAPSEHCALPSRKLPTAQQKNLATPEGMQGRDAPRPRATVAHLRFCKQAAPRSSQTLHRNTALYLQENAQPRSKRTSPPLVGMQGSDAPRLRAMATHLQFANKQHPARHKQTNTLYPQ